MNVYGYVAVVGLLMVGAWFLLYALGAAAKQADRVSSRIFAEDPDSD